MAKNPKTLAEELKALLQSGGKPFLTMKWSDLYERAGWQRFTDARWESTREACLAVGLIVGYGNNIVSLCPDAEYFT